MSASTQPNSIDTLTPAEQATFQKTLEMLRTGERSQAETNLRELADRYPQLSLFLYLLANLEAERGRLDEAMGWLERARMQEPREAKILQLLAQCREASNQHERALECHLELHALAPNDPLHLSNIGFCYSKTRQFKQARDYLERALEREPNNSRALNELALVMMNLDDPDTAISLLQRALQQHPERPGYHGNIAQAFLWKEDHANALQHFREATRHHYASLKPPVHGTPLRVSRIVHDFEQLDYLCELGSTDPVHEDYLRTLEPLAKRAREARNDGQTHFECSDNELDSLRPFYNRLTHLGDGSRVTGKALNPDLDVEAIEATYHGASPEMLVLDNVLCDEALDKLYRYCLESRIFVHENEAGYLGALLSQGFGSPLLLQISEEIRKTFPNIFGENRLTQSWAFKYDSNMTGIKTHADFASVNMNFWISPDRGNLDPDHGGLVVWNKESPKDWPISDYNGNETKVAEFLREEQAEEVVIPFRQNRAAIFNSNLFHRTDDISFADVYTDRRINVTFLFGAGLRL